MSDKETKLTTSSKNSHTPVRASRGMDQVLHECKKFSRYAGIYGPYRTLFKALARRRWSVPLVHQSYPHPDIAIVGCGQFALSTIGYFITRKYGRRIRCCYDTNPVSGSTFAHMLGVKYVAGSFDDIIRDPEVQLIYIASNHASHSSYAVTALKAGKSVYIEKPIAVSTSQLAELISTHRQTGGRVFAGYNRPFSAAVRFLRAHVCDDAAGGISLNCCVSAHTIDNDHWYRNPEEGTRVCGNAGHWIDLFIHLLTWRSLPDLFDIGIMQANPMEPSDNICITITTDKEDIFSLFFSSRAEPFEGVNETINMQFGDVIGKIDDFRKLTLWKQDELHRLRFWPKDAGHRTAVLQPFSEHPARNWTEVVCSTALMLQITEMVRDGALRRKIVLSEELKRLGLA